MDEIKGEFLEEKIFDLETEADMSKVYKFIQDGIDFILVSKKMSQIIMSSKLKLSWDNGEVQILNKKK